MSAIDALLLPIDSILVADRYRKEIGDVADLMKSIVEVGLLNPITVREWHGGYRLVAGERRLTAFRQLGLVEIPALVAHDIADARDALVAERDENTARKAMLPSEATALGMAIEEMEKPAALARQSPGRPPNIPGPRTRDNEKEDMRPRDIAAEAIGMGEASYRRTKTLVTLAADETQTEEMREAAREAMENIDNGAPIRREYDRVKAARSQVGTEPSVMKNHRGRAPLDALRGAVGTLDGLSIPLRGISSDDLTPLDPKTRAHWAHVMNDALGAIRYVKNLLNKEEK